MGKRVTCVSRLMGVALLLAALNAHGGGAARLVAGTGEPDYAVLAHGPSQYRPVLGRTFWFSLGGGESYPAQIATLKAIPIADLGPISCGVAEWEYSFHNLKNGQEDGAGYKHYGGYPVTPKTRAEAAAVVKAYYDKLCADARAKASPEQRALFSSINGHYCYQHYGCEWGCDIVGSETGENINSTQAHIAFTRGAARQYGKPWLLDFSSWYGPSMYDEDPVKHWGEVSGPDHGHSISLHLRTYYLGYMAGAEVVVAEGGWMNCFKSQTPGPDGLLPRSRLGEQASAFYRFTQRHPDRGVPYAPIGLLMDFYHGIYPGFNEKLAWNVFPYTSGDQEILNVWETFFPDSLDVQKKRNEKGYLVASPYGDIVDVILSNVPAGVLSNYPVLLVAGDVDFGGGLAQRLRAYVRSGGTLLISESKFKDPEFVKGFGVSARTARRTEVLRAKYGKGAVAVYAPERPELLQGLLEQARRELIPIHVSGNVESLYNRTKNGWLVTLVNNEGITKAFREPPKIDPAAEQTVTVTWRGKSKLASASLWGVESDQALDVSNISVRIPPGEVRVVALENSHGRP